MKLSIITINYNNAAGLRKTLASVSAQTYRDIEHIVIDGGSNDESVDIIKEYANQCVMYNVLWVSEKDDGIYNAMNKGIRKATGDYIYILNSGDELAASDVIEKMMSVLDNSSVDILLGNIIHSVPRRKRNLECGKPQQMNVSMQTFYSGTVPHDAAFVKRGLFEKFGYFDEKMKICADWKLYLNMIALGGVQPWYVNIDVVLFDMTGISNTNNELRLAERRAYLEQVLPEAVLKDYDTYAFPVLQYDRLKKHHLWGIAYFIERVLFKLEKWHILR